jgi:V/A-type H+-transporting ATPase subunit D
MAFKFQYNKTTIQELKKQLTLREKALPILKNKETALRMEVKLRQKKLVDLKQEKEKIMKEVSAHPGFWVEFPKLLFVNNLKLEREIIIGVKVPRVGEVAFSMADFDWMQYPAWLPAGMEMLKKATLLDMQLEVLEEQIHLLDTARKKTTQKVNLYEKVQIPEMEQATIKIKRFLEDKENIAVAGQKIMKKKKVQSG